MGISVFQEEAIQPAKEKQIPIAILNTNHPEEDGTLVVDSANSNANQLVTGIAGKKDYVVISIQKYQLNKRLDVMAKCSQLFKNLVLNWTMFQPELIQFNSLPNGLTLMVS